MTIETSLVNVDNKVYVCLLIAFAALALGEGIIKTTRILPPMLIISRRVSDGRSAAPQDSPPLGAKPNRVRASEAAAPRQTQPALVGSSRQGHGAGGEQRRHEGPTVAAGGRDDQTQPLLGTDSERVCMA